MCRCPKIDFCSKSGLCFPSIRDLELIKERYADKVKILIDCCQFRLLKSEFDQLLSFSDAIFLSFLNFSSASFAGVVVLGHELTSLYTSYSYTDKLKKPLSFCSITKELLTTLQSTSKLSTFYDCIAVLMKLDLGVSRLSQYFSLREQDLISKCRSYHSLVSQIFEDDINIPPPGFTSKISSTISLLRLSNTELTGRQVYNALCSLYVNQRILVGQPVDSRFNGNLRLSLGFRLLPILDSNIQIFEQQLYT